MPNHTRNLSTSLFFFVAVMLNGVAAQPMTEAEWREDIAVVVDTIRAEHPDPFEQVEEETFNAMHQALLDDLPELNDNDAALRLAALVAVMKDGHSRLSIPRAHNGLAFLQGHTGPNEAARDGLVFSSLPFRYFLFEDGLHIVEAAKGYEQFIGAKILTIGNMEAMDAVEAVGPILFVENDNGANLLSADRLALTEVLTHFDIIDDASSVPLTIEQNGETKTITVKPLPTDIDLETVKPQWETPPLSALNPGEKKWHARIPRQRAWYIRLNEIESFPDAPLTDFFTDAFSKARRSGAKKLILDLRHNQGGNGTNNTAIVNAIGRSRFNEYGRFYVLVGRETFSAAAMLINDFEQYTQVIFVGEPSGARPSHYGDPRRLVLPNSGLTLRVSTIYWQSWLAGDFRDALNTHLDAKPTATDFFAGHDSAIATALDYTPPPTPARQMAELFDKDKVQAGVTRYLGWINSPLSRPHDGAEELVAIGNDYLDAGDFRRGRYMMVMARDFYPTHADAFAGLGRALELDGDLESAGRQYERALNIDENNATALEGRDRLAAAGVSGS